MRIFFWDSSPCRLAIHLVPRPSCRFISYFWLLLLSFPRRTLLHPVTKTLPTTQKTDCCLSFSLSTVFQVRQEIWHLPQREGRNVHTHKHTNNGAHRRIYQNDTHDLAGNICNLHTTFFFLGGTLTGNLPEAKGGRREARTTLLAKKRRQGNG